MMTIEKEEKLLKTFGIIVLLVFLPLNAFILKNDSIKLAISIPILVVFTILYIRKFLRDKKANKDLSKYKRLLLFLVISILMFMFFLVLPTL